MKNIKKVGPSQFIYQSKENKNYGVTLMGSDTTTIQIFDAENGTPVPMDGNKVNVKIWDEVETYLFDYYDKIS